VVPSAWEDVLPTVVIEALAHGRPVLGTALGGIPYLVDQAGWVIPADPSALAAALPVARDGAATLSAVARRRYQNTFHPDLVTKQLIEVYAALSVQRSPAAERDAGQQEAAVDHREGDQ
jgi:glycosyltransferase involved in cell wall biosynthesis